MSSPSNGSPRWLHLAAKQFDSLAGEGYEYANANVGAGILMAGIQRIGNVFYRVPDMDAAVRFYVDVMGFGLKLRDGDHWAAFDVGGATLAVEGGAPGGLGGATVSLRVDGLEDVVAELRAKGATVGDVTTGPHERRARLQDPAGNQLVLYEPL